MRVGSTAIDAADLADRLKARAAPRRLRAPNCTHITMERVWLGDDIQCPVCGRVPSLGFLYECRQDTDVSFSHCKPAVAGNSISESGKSTLRQELEEVGLSESVIHTAEQGGYTEEQLEKLKILKEQLKQVIADTVQAQQINNAVAKLACYRKGPSNNDGAFNSSLTKEMSSPSCHYSACHTCRPYFKDRIFISFDAALTGECKPVTDLDAAFLPTKSLHIMRTIGLSQPSCGSADGVSPSTLPTSTDYTLDSASTTSRSSALTFKTTQSDMDDLDETRRHRRRFYKMGHRSSGSISRDLNRLPLFTRQGLKSAFQGLFRPSRESSSSGSNITLPMPRTSFARSLDDIPAVGEFDMGALRRVRRQKERNDLRNGMHADEIEGVRVRLYGQTRHARSVEEDEGGSTSSEYTVYSCGSEGSEVEVDGGVALTEEAVETHTPDIISDPLMAQQAGVGQDGVDLGSIMTQV
ncbi:hypothetical protein K458DRAFT_321916 [Lentithecium fluviatile CBS 122367]|uniref:Uncharacterized protein n=1 Tax=Lentithecium fluviatile CBS 122367 TaxID=1168545 RepID=A0A6G1IED2_9PLEO|nr:hypothetical protein K458DRAFT_321916 [Lentithecium fluviatile CBS 122367]